MKPRDTELILRVARLYYEKGQSQDRVARTIGTSRSNISRMLSDAKRLGFVQIKVVAPVVRHDSLSNQLKKALDIDEVEVIGSDRSETALTTVGRAAAMALVRTLKPNMTIAISWGRSVEASILEVQCEDVPGLRVTQLMGGFSSVTSSSSGEELGRILAVNLHAQFVPLLSPAVVSNSKTRNTLLNEGSIDQVLDIARQSNIALVGIGSRGSPSSEEVLNQFNLSKTQHNTVAKKYAGDISARFYTESGNSVSAEMDNRVVGLTLEEISKIPWVLGVASGSEKAIGVLGAARAGLINTLITDVACATEVLKFLTTAKAGSKA